LKHDVGVLKQISDLRDVTKTKGTRKPGADVTARRDARKDLRRLAKSEADNDAAQLEELRRQESEAMESLMKMHISDTAIPSLLPVVKYLVQDYVCRMPNELCQSCGKPILPAQPQGGVPSIPAADPSSQTTGKAKGGRKAEAELAAAMKPMRTFCGHWLHFKCLDEWLTTPPFIRQCPVCSRRIWHPDWPEDVKQIERAWQNEQARKREIADIADFLGGGF
jgi:hypothetical protein